MKSPRDIALDFVLIQEGGYVNDAIDMGGVTNYGISFRFLKTLAPELADIDGDGDIDAEDIAAMTQIRAREIYRAEFWEKMRLAELPGRLSIVMLDTAVNMGRGTAVRMLQRTLNDAGLSKFGRAIHEDGILGPVTAEWATLFGDQGTLVSRMLLARIWRYQEIVEKNRKLLRFLLGWVNRVKRLAQIVG